MSTAIAHDNLSPSIEFLLEFALRIVKRIFGRCERCGFTPEDIAGEAVSDSWLHFRSDLGVPFAAYVAERAAWRAGEYNRKLKRAKYSRELPVDPSDFDAFEASADSDPLAELIFREEIKELVARGGRSHAARHRLWTLCPKSFPDGRCAGDRRTKSAGARTGWTCE